MDVDRTCRWAGETELTAIGVELDGSGCVRGVPAVALLAVAHLVDVHTVEPHLVDEKGGNIFRVGVYCS